MDYAKHRNDAKNMPTEGLQSAMEGFQALEKRLRNKYEIARQEAEDLLRLYISAQKLTEIAQEELQTRK